MMLVEGTRGGLSPLHWNMLEIQSFINMIRKELYDDSIVYICI